MSDLNLSINKELVMPIIESKVKAAIMAAFDDQNSVVEKIVDQILTQKVNSAGDVSKSSYDNKYSWMDIVITKTIQDQTKAAMLEILSKYSKDLESEIVDQLKTKSGRSKIAKALINGMEGTFKNSWRSSFKVEFTERPE